MITPAYPCDVGRLRDQFCDLLDVHPMQDWSAGLLQAMTGVLEMYVADLGLQKDSAPVLELVRET
jgi:hypothetical protein